MHSIFFILFVGFKVQLNEIESFFSYIFFLLCFFVHFSFYVCSCLHLYGQLTVHKKAAYMHSGEHIRPKQHSHSGIPTNTHTSIHILTVCMCRSAAIKMLDLNYCFTASWRAREWPQEDTRRMSGKEVGQRPPFAVTYSHCLVYVCWKNNVIHVLES